VPSLFDVRPRNDEDWVRAGFPAKTLFAVEYNGGIEVEPEEDSSVATVHIHADAHNKLVNSPLGASLQPLLGAEILLTILLESFSDWKDISQVEAASPLATLLKQLSKASPITLDELKAMAREPRKLRGLLQDRLSVIQQL
jgi:hypothetical protein